MLRREKEDGFRVGGGQRPQCLRCRAVTNKDLRKPARDGNKTTGEIEKSVCPERRGRKGALASTAPCRGRRVGNSIVGGLLRRLGLLGLFLACKWVADGWEWSGPGPGGAVKFLTFSQ